MTLNKDNIPVRQQVDGSTWSYQLNKIFFFFFAVLIRLMNILNICRYGNGIFADSCKENSRVPSN